MSLVLGNAWLRRWQYFRQPRVWRLCVSRWLSDCGDAAQVLAFNWLVIAETGSATAAGLCSALWLTGQLLGAWPLGWLTDRSNAHTLLIGSNLLHALVIAVYTAFFLHGTGWLAPAVLSLILGILGAAGEPAQRSLIKQSSPNERELARLNGLLSSGGALAQCLGPLAAGWLVGWAPVALPFYLNVASFLGAALLLGPLKIPGLPVEVDAVPETASTTLIGQLRPLMPVIVAVFVFLSAPVPLIVSFLPYYVQQVRHWPAANLGLLEAARWAGLGLGTLAGSLLVTRGLNPIPAVRFGLPLLIVPLAGFAWSTAEGVSLAAGWFASLGLLAGGAYLCLNQLLLQQVGTAWIGRVSGALTSVAGVGLIVGWLGWSWLIDRVGYTVALQSSVLLFLPAVIYVLLWDGPKLRPPSEELPPERSSASKYL